MKSNGKKFLSALLVSSMVLTSSIGFMPRTAQAVSDSTVYSYDFEYISQVTEKGNRKIVIKFDEGKDLKSIDSTKISMVGDTTASIGQVSADYNKEEVSIVVDGIDPSELDYTLKVEAGAFEFDEYQQLEAITISFKSYDITPGFKSIFKDAEEANKLLDRNDVSEIILHVDSDYITDIKATKYADMNLSTIGVKTTAEVDSVEIEVIGISGDNTRSVSSSESDGDGLLFKGNFAGLSGIHVINVVAYDASGKKLDEQAAKNDFSTTHGTNFNTNNVSTFDSAGYVVKDIIDGTVNINDVIAGKSYDELDEINVQYAKADNIFSVATGEELANALADIKGLTGKTATIKLTADITVGREVVFENDERLTIKGNGNTITGDVQLGNDNDQTVRFVNVNVVGNLEVNVGDGVGGDAYLTDVNITDGDLIVTSGDFSSVYLTRVITSKMQVKNLNPVHIVAAEGTAIGLTELVKPDTGDNGDVQLTMAGGSFGTDLVNKMSNAKLILEGKTFEKLTIDSISVAPVVKLLANTEITEMVANKAVTMTGENSSSIATSSNSTGVITYDGFIIEDAKASSNYVGTSVPGSSGNVADKVTIPTSNDNKISLGGTIVTDSLTTNDAGTGAYLTITLDGNINWKTAVDKDTAELKALLQESNNKGSSYANNANITATKLLNSKTLKVTFGTFTGADPTLQYKVDPSKVSDWKNLVDPDASILGTSDWGGTDGTTKLDYTASLYKPVVQGTGMAFVYAYQEMKTTGFTIEADKNLSVVTIDGIDAGLKLSDFEYASNDANWKTFGGDDDQAVSTLFAGMDDDETRILQLRVKGASEASDVTTFKLKKNEPWILDAKDAEVTAAFVDSDVTGIWLQGDTEVDLSADALTKDQVSKIGERSSAFEVRLQGDKNAEIKFPMGTADSKIQKYSGITITADTTAPAGFDATDVGVLSFDNNTGEVVVKTAATLVSSTGEGGHLEVAFAKTSTAINTGSIYKSSDYNDLSGAVVSDGDTIISSIEEQDGDLNVYYRLVDYAGNASAWVQDGIVPSAPTAAVIDADAAKNAENYITEASKAAVKVTVTTAGAEPIAEIELKDASGHSVKNTTRPSVSKAAVAMDTTAGFTEGDELTIVAKAIDSGANVSKSAEFAAGKFDTTVPTVSSSVEDSTTQATITFSEKLDPATVIVGNFVTAAGTTTSAVELQADGKTVVVTTVAAMTGTETITVGVGVKDVAGNPLASTLLTRKTDF